MIDRNQPHAPFDPSDEQISEAAFHAAMRDVTRDQPMASLAGFSTSVYALVDPRTKRVVYVGLALDPERRLRQHCDPDRRTNNRELWGWIAGLKAGGLRPGLSILEEGLSPEEADIAEHGHIKRFKGFGQAEFNRAAGGRGNRSCSKLDSATPDDFHFLDRELIQLHADALEILHTVNRLLPMTCSNKAADISRRIDDFRVEINAYLELHRPAWGRGGGGEGDLTP